MTTRHHPESEGPFCQSAGCPKKRHAATWTWSNGTGWRMNVCDKVRDKMVEEGLAKEDFAPLKPETKRP